MIRRALALAALLAALPAGAATYYVDTATGNDSNAGTIGSRWATVQKCTTTMSGGDTCVVYPGTYVGDGATSFNLCGSSSRDLSGPSSLAYTAYVAATSTKPRLCRNSSCTTSGANLGASNISMGNWGDGSSSTLAHTCQFIKLDGFEVHGMISVWRISNTVADIQITNSDLSGGGHNDGNSTVIFMQDDTRASGKGTRVTIDHNRFHDIEVSDACPGGTPFCQYAFIKSFGVTANVIEYNTFDTHGIGNTGVGAPAPHATSVGAFDDKDCPFNSIFRFNHVRGGTNTNVIVREAQQCTAGTSQGGDQIYGNVSENDGIAFLTPQSYDTPWLIHHNTFIAPGGDAPLDTSTSGFKAFTFRDNIIAGTTQSVDLTSNGASNVLDYNAYTTGTSWRVAGGASSTLAAWRTAIQGAGCSGCEAHSIERSVACSNCSSNTSATVAPCTLVSGADTPYHVSAGDATCMTGSSTGGELGAYGAPGSTGCVGWTCGVTAPAQTCGNAIREGAETCDGSDTNGQTCITRGFSGGTLACCDNVTDGASCSVHDCTTFDTSACTVATTQSAHAAGAKITGGAVQ